MRSAECHSSLSLFIRASTPAYCERVSTARCAPSGSGSDSASCEGSTVSRQHETRHESASPVSHPRFEPTVVQVFVECL